MGASLINSVKIKHIERGEYCFVNKAKIGRIAEHAIVIVTDAD